MASQAELLKNNVKRFKLKEKQNISDVNSELMNMIENIVNEKKAGNLNQLKNDSDNRDRIKLDSSEFGKYW